VVHNNPSASQAARTERCISTFGDGAIVLSAALVMIAILLRATQLPPRPARASHIPVVERPVVRAPSSSSYERAGANGTGACTAWRLAVRRASASPCSPLLQLLGERRMHGRIDVVGRFLAMAGRGRRQGPLLGGEPGAEYTSSIGIHLLLIVVLRAKISLTLVSWTLNRAVVENN
jgi:hypothetical protein